MCFSHSNLELCSLNALNYMKCFAVALSRTHLVSHCTMHNILSSLFAWLVLISVLTRTLLNNMYSLLRNVTMACSPVSWWVPTPYAFDYRSCVYMQSFRFGVHAGCSLCAWLVLIYIPTRILIMNVYNVFFTQQSWVVQPQCMELHEMFCCRFIQNLLVSVLHHA
jgi:hypothetical protein